ncbi:unnamed protein product [Rotaria sp. Silwood2]|nr:unnamed protein product [Rotaria sp. Silwood2]CAF3312437.1 unnamed protein product [Rotaria sp. Silwood2]CAF4255006.1 unnamed protein product [Rotaria sp. Silwood2]CAF4340960.1 unnamed protein product [Rotaria sp. Silwood2]CAF4342092.1 unnamed protein product [Rotaria sp. Silwood2]
MSKISDSSNSTPVVVNKSIYYFFAVLVLFTITTVALTAAILGVVINRLDVKNTSSTYNNEPISFVDQIKIEDLMKHLEQLQVIADRSNGTRAIATGGFNDTIDYITNELEQNTNFKIQRQYFTVRNHMVRGTPQLQTRINGITTNHVYLANFTHILFSASANFDTFVQVVTVPNLGCLDTDWTNVSVLNSVALVKRGNCTYAQKFILAEKYQVKGLLIYNDGISSDGFNLIQGIRNNLNATIPAYFLSYNLGMQLVNGANNVEVIMNINVSDTNGIANICADTATGDETKTIVIGAHSDGVPAGSGINDNGSGTVGILVLALNLARLFQTSSSQYSTYQYRVRFCWWGAEELGLIGARYHVEQALLPSNNAVGERLQDYLVNLNYDMLAGPNYRFGIHDSSTVPLGTPDTVLNGTHRIMDLFRQWFNEQKLPWSNSSLGGGSDYVPFLAAGIAVGGVNTGAGGIKSAAERDLYSAVLGTGNGGIANAAFDPCYHQQCDRIRNINPFAYEKVVKAAAHAIEYLGRLNDLEKWLYPQRRPKNFELLNRYQSYNFYNDSDLNSS